MQTSFWALESPPDLQLAEEIRASAYEATFCQMKGGYRHAVKPAGDLSVVVDPAGVKDLTWSWTGHLLISQRVLDLLDKHRVTGFEVRQAKVSYSESTKEPPPELLELIVTGWGGLAAPDARVSLIETCPACGQKCYAIAEPSRVIDPASWDGSDMFVVWPLPRFRFISQRLASILHKEAVSGAMLVPALEIPVPSDAKACPGTLALSMPEKRAAELEQRFDVSNWRGNVSRTGLIDRISRWWAARS